MTPEKIIEIARRFDPHKPDFVMTEATIIAFAQAIIEAERKLKESIESIAWSGVSASDVRLFATVIRLFATVIILCFLFSGDPDVFDLLHAYVMRVLQ